MRFIFHSSVTLEPWDWTNPWTQGIGGSETSHIELAARLARRGHEVLSYAPVPWRDYERDNEGVIWRHVAEADYTLTGTWLIYRDPYVGAKITKGPDQRFWFVAQDVDYDWNDERLALYDKYVCLCAEHCRFTASKYPAIKDRIFQSSNGVRRDIIEQVEAEEIERDPRRIVWASSPDRGLVTVLQQWPRILERVPDAKLDIYYGVNNMEALLARDPNAWFRPQYDDLLKLKNQDGVTWRGRVAQMELYRAWFGAGLWWYPSNWPETSCITCMEAQACGAVPVLNRFWAQGENVFHGVVLDGPTPQDSALMRASLTREVIDLMRDRERQEFLRPQLMADARDSFDWEKMVTQLEAWAE